MFLIKIFHFVKGYVILSISGHNKEEFLNSILNIGIAPRNLEACDDKIYLELSLSDFWGLRKSGVHSKVHIEKKCGLVFLIRRILRRWAFLAGLFIFLLMFTLGSQFVWTVNYEGVENCDIVQLSSAVKLAGLRAGMLKKNLRPAVEMKNIILNNTDGICWAWVYIKGTKAIVRVRENIIPPQVFSPDTPCDIVAMRSGIIKRVITRHGKCIVNDNQAVTAGDTIISGTYELKNDTGYQVHASGEVEAYTEHTRTGIYKQNYCYKKYTGRQRNFITLRLFKWEIPLFIRKNVGFDSYDSETREYDLKLGEDFFVGVGVSRTSCREYTTEKEPISYDAAVEFAKNELERDISRELLPEAKLVDKNLDVQKIDEETISVTLTMNFIEKIGTEKRIEEVTFIEPKTDRVAAGN